MNAQKNYFKPILLRERVYVVRMTSGECMRLVEGWMDIQKNAIKTDHQRWIIIILLIMWKLPKNMNKLDHHQRCNHHHLVQHKRGYLMKKSNKWKHIQLKFFNKHNNLFKFMFVVNCVRAGSTDHTADDFVHSLQCLFWSWGGSFSRCPIECSSAYGSHWDWGLF